MNQTPRLALLTLSFGLLAACSTGTRQAPIVERPATVSTRVRPAPPVSVQEDPKQETRGNYTVRRGDTLLRIALDHGQNYRDLVVWNSLADPDDIKVGQVLRVAPPERVAGVQTLPVPMPETRAQVPRKPMPKAERRPVGEAGVAEAPRSDAARPEKAEPAVAAVSPAPSAGSPAAGSPAAGSPATTTDDEKMSWMWPSDGKIIATFDDGRNKGIDIAGKPGQQVMAAGAGKVMYAGSGIRGYGNLVIVKHSNSLLSAYAHNRSIVVKEGQTVSKGQVIAEMGDSDADSVKLHFEIRQQGKPVDPSRFLPSR
jgi:lipoprotein NlpD